MGNFMDQQQDNIQEIMREIVDRISPRLIEIRRHLHAHPELSGQERETAAYVAGVLTSCGLPVTEQVGKQGLLAELAPSDRSSPDRRHLAIRTDLDALPITEGIDSPFKSRSPGVMHACGHDIHTTIGLGTAMVLSELGGLPGCVRFIFQSAEEIAQGAHWMVADGAMADIDAILSLHVFPSIPVGQIGIRYGALTAAADDIELEIQGESGHGARPHEAIDAIWIAAQVITSLQGAIARTQNALRPVVLTFGKIEGGRAPNVIADRVKLSGTVRSLHPDTYAQLPEWIEGIIAQTCQIYGATYKLHYHRAVPAVQNDLMLTKLLEASVIEALGPDAVYPIHEPSLGAEDFAVYLNQAPGSMFRLGVGGVDRLNYPLHHPLFDPDERSIHAGVITMATAAIRYFTP